MRRSEDNELKSAMELFRGFANPLCEALLVLRSDITYIISLHNKIAQLECELSIERSKNEASKS